MSTEPAGWPEGTDRIVLDETDSTNAEAARRAPGFTRPTWIFAHRQTAARGRRGRPWANPEGNFAATLVLKPGLDAASAAQLSFVASLALLRALLGVLPPAARIELKWPNDVLLNGGKVAGILLEASGDGKRIDWLAIGVGVNLLSAPDPGALEAGALRPVSVYSETGVWLRAEDLLDRLAPEFDAQFRLWDKERFATYRALWLRHAARLGQRMTARIGNTETTGLFETVDEDGNLVLRTPEGLRRIAAADVYFD